MVGCHADTIDGDRLTHAVVGEPIVRGPLMPVPDPLVGDRVKAHPAAFGQDLCFASKAELAAIGALLRPVPGLLVDAPETDALTALGIVLDMGTPVGQEAPVRQFD